CLSLSTPPPPPVPHPLSLHDALPIYFPQEAGTARHGLTDVNAGGHPRCESADDRDLVSRRFHDLLARLCDTNERPANSRYRPQVDRKSTRLNSSHVKISYAVFCLKKK